MNNGEGGERVTQFGRALEALNIDIICANSPQAKGWVERAFGTLQVHFRIADRPAQTPDVLDSCEKFGLRSKRLLEDH